jgi:hypothetical protein
MILAAAEAARSAKATPPPELQLAWECLEMHALPRSGGLWRQPAGLVRRMRVALRVYEAVDTWQRSANWRALQENDPRVWEIVTWVVSLQRQAAEGRLQ